MKQIGRRKFFAIVARGASALALAPLLLKSFPARSDALLPMVESSDGMAKSVQYVTDAKKNPNSKGNSCATCALYTKKEMRAGKEVGACALFPNKLVSTGGFCNSWNKKQKS